MKNLMRIGVGLLTLAGVLGGCDAIDEAFDPVQVSSVQAQ
jgi:hypothetical protein